MDLLAWKSGNIDIYKFETDSIHSLLGYPGNITAIDTRTKGMLIVTYPGNRNMVKISKYDLEKKEHQEFIENTQVNGSPERISRMVAKISHDSKYLLYTNSVGKIRIQDLTTGKYDDIIAHKAQVLTINTMGEKIVLGSMDGEVKIWKLQTGELLQTLVGHRGSVLASAFLDENTVVSGSYDRTLRIWNIINGQEFAHVALDGTVECLDTVYGSKKIFVGDRLGNVYSLTYTDPDR